MDKFKLAKNELEKFCVYKPKSGCQQIFCILHEAAYLGSHDGTSHACLACNLNDSLEHVYKFLRSNRYLTKIEYTFSIYILLLYLLIEKLHTVFKVIEISFEFVEENWPILIEIRKWANFIKHPKGFLFAHHPVYIIEDEPIPDAQKEWKKITYSNFIVLFYDRERKEKFQQTMIEFANQSELIVLIPNPERMAKELNSACTEFCQMIKDNPQYRVILTEHSVLENYYIQEITNEVE